MPPTVMMVDIALAIVVEVMTVDIAHVIVVEIVLKNMSYFEGGCGHLIRHTHPRHWGLASKIATCVIAE